MDKIQPVPSAKPSRCTYLMEVTPSFSASWSPMTSPVYSATSFVLYEGLPLTCLLQSSQLSKMMFDFRPRRTAYHTRVRLSDDSCCHMSQQPMNCRCHMSQQPTSSSCSQPLTPTVQATAQEGFHTYQGGLKRLTTRNNQRCSGDD
jgi:hypothetical protein